MEKLLIAGAGRIGSLIAYLLSQTNEYQIYLADTTFHRFNPTRAPLNIPNLETVYLDAQNEKQLAQFLQEKCPNALISSLPYFCNPLLAKLAKQFNITYFDLTEDTQTTAYIRELAQDSSAAFVPQCGLAPGFIEIVATALIKDFDQLDSVKLRVGALPQAADNSLHYALNWSTDGLINEYSNNCKAIEQGEVVTLAPLEGLELLELDGASYEAFNTSGGIGNLIERLSGKTTSLNYKTLRYPGHCEKMRFLLFDLKLNQDRQTLKKILEHAIPQTQQDLVIIYVAISGWQQGTFTEKNYIKKIYPQTIAGRAWSAIQVATATSLCCIVDLVLKNPTAYQGFIAQETFALADFLANRFGQYYR